MANLGLPPSAGELILASRPSYVAFSRIAETRFVACGFHDLLYVAVGVLDTSFSKDIIHTDYLLKRQPGAADWSKAELYHIDRSEFVTASNILDLDWEEIVPLIERVTPEGEKEIMRLLQQSPRE